MSSAPFLFLHAKHHKIYIQNHAAHSHVYKTFITSTYVLFSAPDTTKITKSNPMSIFKISHLTPMSTKIQKTPSYVQKFRHSDLCPLLLGTLKSNAVHIFKTSAATSMCKRFLLPHLISSALLLVSKDQKDRQFKCRIYIQNTYSHIICLLQTAYQNHHRAESCPLAFGARDQDQKVARSSPMSSLKESVNTYHVLSSASPRLEEESFQIKCSVRSQKLQSKEPWPFSVSRHQPLESL